MSLFNFSPLAAPVLASHPPRLAPLAFGDLQGCCDAFQRLLDKLDPSPETPLWFAGDLVNRGPCSLQTLRSVMALGDRAISVLGNHDLHLLAVVAGVRKVKRGDTITDILDAPDAAELIDWVRRRPLAHADQGMLMVHAGVLPQWTVQDTLAYAAEVEAVLRAPTWQTGIAGLFGDQPTAWDDALSGMERLRVIANALTRLRFCTIDGHMDFGANGTLSTAPAHCVPWYDLKNRQTADVTVVFGHWAAMGLVLRPNLCGLDTGCVWGNRLSAIVLDADPARRVLTQVECPKAPASA